MHLFYILFYTFTDLQCTGRLFSMGCGWGHDRKIQL